MKFYSYVGALNKCPCPPDARAQDECLSRTRGQTITHTLPARYAAPILELALETPLGGASA